MTSLERFTIAIFMTACAGQGEVRTEPVPTSPSAATSAASAVHVARAGPWEEAAHGDALAAARLAELHPAPDLLAVARGDAERAPAALLAIGEARDAELVLGSLAEMARTGVRRRAALESIHRAVHRGPRDTEPLDPSSLARCIRALDALSRDAKVARADRAIAVSALRRLARAGLLDEARITTVLDP